MNAGSFAYVMLRLGAIAIAYQALQQLPYLFTMIQGYLAGKDAVFLWGSFGFLFLTGTSCFLWFAARWLSGKVVAPLKEVDQLESGTLTPDTLLQVGLVIFGVYVLFQTSTSLIIQLVSMATMGAELNYVLEVFLRTALFAGFGIACITSPRSLAAFFMKLRRAGTPKRQKPS